MSFLSQMLDLLTSAYSREDFYNSKQGQAPETNIGKLFSIFAWGLDKAKEQADKVKSWDDIDNASGAVLDRYGENFGVKRQGMSDAFYRLAIQVKMIALLSGGDVETVLMATSSLLGVETTDVLLDELFPAKIEMFVDQRLLTPERLDLVEPIAWAVKRILAGGVGMRLYLRTYREYRRTIHWRHGGFVVFNGTSQPISQDRQARRTVGFGLAGFAEAGFAPPMQSEDRSSRMELPYLSGGYAEADFAPPMHGDDRTAKMDISISLGSFLEPGVLAAPVSEDRRADVTFGIANASYAEGKLDPPMQSEDRSSTMVTEISLAGFAGTGENAPPISEDRELATAVNVARGASSGAGFTPPVHGDDRSHSQTVQKAQGAFLGYEANFPPSGDKKSFRGAKNSAGGNIYHAHIKSKRVD